MKKTKLLMPLMGLTVLGAVAPVMTITSCNKGTDLLVNSACAGNLYDQTKKLMTNRIGKEYLNFEHGQEDDQPVQNLKFMLHLSNPIPENHTLYIEIDVQGHDSKWEATGEQTAFAVRRVDPAYIYTEPNQNWITLDMTKFGNPVVSNQKIIKELAEAKAEASFTFNIKLSEKDEANQDVATQVVPLTLVACPAKHDLPSIAPIKASEGADNELYATSSSNHVTFEGLKFTNMTTEVPFHLEFFNKEILCMEAAEGDRTIFIDPLNPIQPNNDGTFNFEGDCWFGSLTDGERVNFSYWCDMNINFVCKEEEGNTEHFVISEWQCTGTIRHKHYDEWFVNNK